MNELEKSAFVQFLSDLSWDCDEQEMFWGENGAYILRCLVGRGFKIVPDSPIVFAEKTDDGLAKITCPLCGETHTHGWESGHRGAHCADAELKSGGYILFCAEEKHLDAIRRALEKHNWP